jgi:hypothetical protein
MLEVSLLRLVTFVKNESRPCPGALRLRFTGRSGWEFCHRRHVSVTRPVASSMQLIYNRSHSQQQTSSRRR